MPPDIIDPGNPRTWPPWMREDVITTEGDHVGPYPASRFQWRKVAPPPVKFGSRISAWHRNTVAAICKLPLPDPEIGEQPALTERAAPAAAPARSRINQRRKSRAAAIA